MNPGIRLIVGLGNPGRDYENTRHNAGFWWLDKLAQDHKVTFRIDSKFQGLVARITFQQQEIWLLKPQTFMNLSGRAVGALAQFYKVSPHEMLVVHDELDLPPGTAKLKTGGGHGGHNGLKDIIAHLGSKEFWRLRIGIGHPGDRNEVANFVLKAPGKAEFDLIEQAEMRALALVDLIVSGKHEAAMLKLHSTA